METTPNQTTNEINALNERVRTLSIDLKARETTISRLQSTLNNERTRFAKTVADTFPNEQLMGTELLRNAGIDECYWPEDYGHIEYEVTVRLTCTVEVDADVKVMARIGADADHIIDMLDNDGFDAEEIVTNKSWYDFDSIETDFEVINFSGE